jgi:threonylcarbamoyladenosine tRNA methylthiotransferase MtaB
LGADVIVGFPGESEADHARTVALVNALPFTYLHVFPFSARPGTAAERLDGRVSGSVAGERARSLRALGAEVADRHQARRRGEECDLVVVGSGPRRQGVTEDYLTVGVGAAVPRGTRCRARLEGDPPQLLGVPLPAIIHA